MSTPKGGKGRGRGEGAALAQLEARSTASASTSASERSRGSEGSEHSSERVIRGRGGYRAEELVTRPAMPEARIRPADIEKTSIKCEVMANYVKLKPMREKRIFSYRVDYEPVVEAVPLRRKMFLDAYSNIFGQQVSFDGMSEARSVTKIAETSMTREVEHPATPGTKVQVKLKQTGEISWSSSEMLRLYNINMKKILSVLGYHNVGVIGGYLNTDLTIPVGTNNEIHMIRGYRTAAGIHMDNQVMINFEPVHKIMQLKNLLELFQAQRNARDGGDFRTNIRAKFTGKLVMTQYNKRVYKIEEVDFTKNPRNTFHDGRSNQDITYVQYFQSRYGLRIRDADQPLILVTPNDRVRRQAQDEQRNHDIYLIPELCSLAGLTDQQRNDNRVKMDLIRSSQIAPDVRVRHLREFLASLHRHEEVKKLLEHWGYEYDSQPVLLPARTLARERICTGSKTNATVTDWGTVDERADFERLVTRDSLAVPPPALKLAIIIPNFLRNNQERIMSQLKNGFDRIRLRVAGPPQVLHIERDLPQMYVACLKNISPDITCCIVIMDRQDKSKYDAIKKCASCAKGLITQVVTARLMMDERKAGGASVKIAIQIAAKVGGEPWYLHIPLKDLMVCGYDTYHDTSNRGRSFGAFVASTNAKHTRYFSKTDKHDRLEELSTHLVENLLEALTYWKEKNGKFPTRIVIYRDGVSDGQLEHVFKVEVEMMKKTLRENNVGSVQLTFIVVNKRIGARFFMKGAADNSNIFLNCPPGTIIDSTVTKPIRYDFYLISQSTRAGTLTPTYYNIIHDDSALTGHHQQALAYKMCLYYYNWTGSVRVPAPCQYAHKLAYLCGEHLHESPIASLDQYLHYL